MGLPLRLPRGQPELRVGVVRRPTALGPEAAHLGLDKRLARASERGASAHASWSVAAGQDRSRRRPSRRRAGWRHQQSRSRANGLKTLGIPSKQAGLALFVGKSGNREGCKAYAYACYHLFKQQTSKQLARTQRPSQATALTWTTRKRARRAAPRYTGKEST